MASVGVVNGTTVAVFDPCVDMAFRVSAADVYKAARVAAGCGVAAAKGPQARIRIIANTGIRSFLK
jgi:hypothetical protein